MTGRGVLLLATLAIAGGVLLTWRPAPPPAAAPGPAAGAAERDEALGLPVESVDPASIRDLFRFVERRAAPAERPVTSAGPAGVSPSPAPELPRLVGLVRRQGRLLAAFAVDGDVVLAGTGQVVAGLSVLEVSEEAVRVRRRDGTEARLALP